MSDKEDRFGVSRRDFLKSAGVGGLATAVTSAGATDVEAQAGPRVVGPGDVPVSLTVNGKRLELRIEPRVTLLDALRNRADLTGNKRVCDRGSCGACTMIVDGRTAYSCSTLAIDVQGKQIRTVEGLAGADKVAGRARYTYDINRPGMIYGRVVRSPYPHARVTSIDLAAAQKAPGVKAVVAYRNPGDEVHYQGDPVAAVAADTEERARDAARLVRVRWEPLPHVSIEAQAMDAAAPKWSTTQENTRPGVRQETGNLETGFNDAAHVVEQTYSTHVITHVCLETHGTVCEWDGDKLTAWVSTQGVHQCAQGYAQALGIPQANVRVITQYMGGGFGSKFAPDSQGIICAQLAKKANAPVKLMLDRKEEHLDTGNRPSAFAHIRAGVSAEGKLTAFDGRSWGTGGAGAGSNFPLPYLYQFPNRKRVHTDVYINAGQQRAMRAPGHPQGCFLTEILMDELADRVKIDPG